jgi:flagellar biosynthesis GTPase FlhF
VGVFLFIVFLLIIAAIIAVPVIVIYSRRQAREQKNYERGLKMVPLLIHLPPISEDTDANGRDVRDLVDENISKAQIIYNIIASTYEKGFKRRLYGQQHFAFEIVSSQGFVFFYTTVPIGLVEVVRQAIVSAYPAARLEEAEEHNIFNVSGKVSGTTGGELVLKESFAYPIATYMDLKRDAMQAMLNSLSTVGKEDGAAIQILLRPADPGWRRKSHAVTESKRKGKDDKGHAGKALGLAKEVGTAFYKPPEDKKDGGSDKPDLSEHEMAVLNAIDDKTRYPAYEVLIRLVASSNVSQKSQTILNNMVAAFSLFDAPGKNGFKYEPASDIDELVSSYIMKFFPQERNKTILNSVELATIFHFPDQRSIPTTQLERQDSKQVDGPRNMPEDGLLLGYNVFRGVKKPVRLAIGDRQRHMYVVGQTGTGKSTFLENLALQDMMSGGGFAFVDPHGDTAEKLLSMVPKERTEDVIYFCPADMGYPMGLNLFEFQNEDQKDFLIQEALNMLKKLYDPNNQGIMGPRYEHLFRNAALTVMADPAGGTFIDIPKLFRDPQYVKQKLQYVKDPNVLEFWQKEMPQSQRSNEFGEVVSWFVSKFGAFLSNEMMRNIIGQTKSAFNLRDVMDNKKILLVNLSKGRTGDLNSKLLGMVFVMQFQAAAMSRANIPEKDRVDFSLYVDEFQNFSTESFATIMSEARKFRLNLIVANQFTTQLSEEIRDAVFGNMGTIVAFRIGQNDVDSLSRYFQPTFDGDDLLRVPNYNAIVRTLIGGVPTQSFSMATLPPLGDPNEKLSDALKQLSAAKYGRPKGSVEKEIFERIATKDDGPAVPGAPAPGQRPFGASPWQPSAAAPGAFGGTAPTRPAAFGASPSPAPAARTGTGSFLDEWLAKRNDGPTTPVAAAAVPATVPAAPFDRPSSAPVAMPVHPEGSADKAITTDPVPPNKQPEVDGDRQEEHSKPSDPGLMRLKHDDADMQRLEQTREDRHHQEEQRHEAEQRQRREAEAKRKADEQRRQAEQERVLKEGPPPKPQQVFHPTHPVADKPVEFTPKEKPQPSQAPQLPKLPKPDKAFNDAPKASAKPAEPTIIKHGSVKPAAKPSPAIAGAPLKPEKLGQAADKPTAPAPVAPKAPAEHKPIVLKPVEQAPAPKSAPKPVEVPKSSEKTNDSPQAAKPIESKAKVIGLPPVSSNTTVVAPQPDIDVLPPKSRQSKLEADLAHGDTIYIDQDGNFKDLDELQEEVKKTQSGS